jgi:hypothetical protein
MSTANDHIRATSEGLLDANWTTTPVAYDSVHFDSDAQDRWIRHTLLTGESFQSGIPACVRHTGIISIQVYTEIHVGTKAAYDIADAINGLYGLKTVSGITFEWGSVTRVGFVEGVFQLTIFIPYRYDESI